MILTDEQIYATYAAWVKDAGGNGTTLQRMTEAAVIAAIKERGAVGYMDADGNTSDNNEYGCFPMALYSLEPNIFSKIVSDISP